MHDVFKPCTQHKLLNQWPYHFPCEILCGIGTFQKSWQKLLWTARVNRNSCRVPKNINFQLHPPHSRPPFNVEGLYE